MEREGPRIQIQPSEASPAGTGRWNLSWTVQNLTDQPITLLEVWLPHGQFRAERQQLTPPLVLPAGGSADIETAVEAPVPPSGVVENAFVILRVRWEGSGWRVFARFRVGFGEDGRPHPLAEESTAQHVGFAEQAL